MRHLVLVLGDQLDLESAAFDRFDPATDAVWMAEVDEEATYVPSHKLRLAYFFAAMRHFRDALGRRDVPVHYHALDAGPRGAAATTLAGVLGRDVARLRPDRLVLVQPGDHRVLEALCAVAARAGVELEVREDRHFFSSIADFEAFARNRRRLVLEDWYRAMRRKHGVLVTPAGEPVGGAWNLDDQNRESFGRDGPTDLPRPMRFRPDAITREVLALVDARFPDHPGRLEHFDLPVTRGQARRMLGHFVRHALPRFGTYEDAMWAGEPFLHHSRLSAPLNLKLLDPRDCVRAAVGAYDAGAAPLNGVEGFVRQILGWREYVRGIYWTRMPGYAALNALGHDRDVPSFYWTGETDMACVRDAMRSVIDHGYAHHIQRLMVLGLLAQLHGVHPYRFHEWHMAMYVDAVDWVSLPNALGMSQFGDGGIVGTKPYCASGNYIDRMSNHCGGCPYDPRTATGSDACPFTTLYWEFLDRHQATLARNGRMGFQLRNLEKKRAEGALAGIRSEARRLRRAWAARRPGTSD